MHCPFCNPTEIVVSNALAYAIYDKYPVSPGHMLIIPKRHVANFFDTSHEERQAIYELMEHCKSLLDKELCPVRTISELTVVKQPGRRFSTSTCT